ncbi:MULTISPECIES: DUF3800 domain-containing protein [unclassified Lysobacter]|uniref:DUF3800 domain-containing protein n=1 Tax=unclassified Lysobacter TaxID=2635362 RepID=UPI001BE634A4|nr:MULTISPECIES: DUF3800 domain-containing protein [unclassified Lysobacter]MBT2748307.1 DUF3800 domain-containing protein [Lysobacter sp. ISL-42]MBT2749926.1 DUF3800 domain-containing protein [Lysobacter sp. ISL-50]MBT2781254.1 DUF3800 domain-containing protein [Lysobacter sp. ISL-52]
MEYFHIDESGFTGYDLLNPEQRFQGTSAVSISDDEAARLIKEFFPRLQAPELKYQSLARRQSYRKPLIELQCIVLSQFKCTTCVADKRFLLILMFLDYAVEPFYFKRQMDFYEDGQNFSLASLLWRVGTTLFGPGAFDQILAAFQRATKEKSPPALRTLVEAVRAADWNQLREALGPLALAAPECLGAIATPGVSTDAALVLLQALITRMEVQSGGPYEARHDQSENLRRYHELLRRYIDHKENAEFIHSKIARLRFPLKLTSVVQVDSKTSPAVQIADVLVGAAVEAVNTLTGQRQGVLDPGEVLSLYAADQLIHYLPSSDFAEQKCLRSGSQASEMIDYFTRHFGDGAT